MNPRASLYVRLSKAADAENLSKGGMIDDLRALCDREGFQEVALHIDDGISGAVRDRPEFVAWLDDAREGRAGVLLAWHVDRMTREGANVAALILDVVEGKDLKSGKTVRNPVILMDTRGIDSRDGESFRFRFVMGAEIARAERERMKDRSQSNSRRLRTAGRWAGGAAPYGYRVVDAPDDAPGKVLEIEPAEARYIRLAVDHVLTGGSLYGALRKLQNSGAKPRKAKRWSISSLKVVLTGDAILGRIKYHQQLVRSSDGTPMTPWPAIVTLREAQQLRALLATTKRGRSRRKAARLLSGLVRCAGCDGTMRVNVTSRRKPDGAIVRVPRYTCHANSDGRECESPCSVVAEPLEKHVIAETIGALGHSEYVEQNWTVPDNVELTEVEASIRDTADELTRPSADLPALVERLTTLRARRDELESAPVEPVLETVATGETLKERWERTDDIDERRKLLNIESVIVWPGVRDGRRDIDTSRLEIIDLGEENATPQRAAEVRDLVRRERDQNYTEPPRASARPETRPR